MKKRCLCCGDEFRQHSEVEELCPPCTFREVLSQEYLPTEYEEWVRECEEDIEAWAPYLERIEECIRQYQ